jgi:serine/threonine-protein kinase
MAHRGNGPRKWRAKIGGHHQPPVNQTEWWKTVGQGRFATAAGGRTSFEVYLGTAFSELGDMLTAPNLVSSLNRALAGQYRIERELGRGGMGVVYLARDLTLDRLVAIKVVHPDLTTNPTVAARFLSEARAIAKLRHPNIVAVHAAGQVDGQLYYVMDYLEGETLRQRLHREGPLEPAVVVAIVSAIAGALDAASESGIVHRDLKPENILLEGDPREPRALLADFGIARLAGDGNTGPGAVMGTPAYMSPEQAAGEELDGRSDLYSLGIVAYEMLVGAPPFAGSHRSVISKQILDRPTPVAVRRAEIRPAMSDAIMRALEKVPDARWPSGRSFRRALSGESLSVVTPAAMPRKRRRWAPVAALTGAAVLAIGTGTALLRGNVPPDGVDPRRSILVLPFDNLRDDPAYEWLRDGSVNMLTLTMSQWRDLTVVDQDRVHDLVRELTADEAPIGLEQARRLARASGAWTVVLGDFIRRGDSLHLVARRYDVSSGQRLDLVQVDGLAGEDVRPLFDQLAARLLDLTGAPETQWATIASVTTNSVLAYRAYLRGIEALNQWRLLDASEALERAVGIDPEFSLANYKLAIARGWISSVDTLGRVAIERAARTSARLPPRDRQLIEGYSAFVAGDFDTGLDLYTQLIGRDSTDVEAWYGWADAAFHGGYHRRDPRLLSRSLQGFRRVIGLDSSFALAYEHAGAMLGDAGQPNGWLELVGRDSLRSVSAKAESPALQAARRQAQHEAVELARAWTRLQPRTPRAYYHLYKAFLGNGRVDEAREAVTRLREMFPDSTQPFFGFLDARAQFVGGDIEGSARTVRSVLPRVRPDVFREIEFAPEPLNEVMTGVDALGYFGDVDGAAEVIRLGRALFEQRPEKRDPGEKARGEEMWELSRLGLLLGATGTRPDQLRSVWDRGISLVRTGTEKDREEAPAVIGSTAIGLLLGPKADPTAVQEIDRLTERQSPAAVRALIAVRAGDSASARELLHQAAHRSDTAETPIEWQYRGDQRPIMAEAYYQLGEYDQVVQVLAQFAPESFRTRGFDSRWILLPRVRLLRGQALEHLGRVAEAATEFRAVVDQWGRAGADVELQPVVREAQRGLARVTGVGERG